MDEPIEEEKKPFEAETMAEEEVLPDPDEQLMLHQGNGRVWLVKVGSIFYWLAGLNGGSVLRSQSI